MTRHKILVVEDDFEIREALIDLLQENGCDAAGAANGVEALRLLRGDGPLPCLILLDLMMPVMDGEAFREAQLEDPKIAHIPVVVISAYRDVQADAERLKAACFMKKPPKLEELVTVIQENC